MTRSRSLSPTTRSVLAVLAEVSPQWSHGYDLCRATGIKSGTLYPLLIRLESQGHLEAEWLPAETGRPPRHAYRLTPAGHRLAAENPPLTARATSLAGRPA
jgi:PadR family transcriptional regulator, regulatory protein PadR